MGHTGNSIQFNNVIARRVLPNTARDPVHPFDNYRSLSDAMNVNPLLYNLACIGRHDCNV